MLINADAATTPLQDKSVHTICTSPPYWSLRNYSGEQERDWPAISYSPLPGLPEITVPAMRCALGLEPDVAAYVGHMVLIFRELYRVLRDDGVVWCVMGDSYAAKLNVEQGNLLMVPHRLALALQGDGWVIRNDCIWAKKAPMPESVSGWRWERCRVKVHSGSRVGPNRNRNDGGESDVGNKPYGNYRSCPGCPKCAPTDGWMLRRGSWRHTRAHEFVLMCVKAMGYWSNQEMVREALMSADRIGADGYYKGNRHFETDVDAARMGIRDNRDAMNKAPSGRNPRSVLSPSPESYSGQHFAVFPTSLIAPLIRATTPARCCPACGAGWAAVVEKDKATMTSPRPFSKDGNQEDRNDVGRIYEETTINILSYRPTCDCNAPHRWEFLGTIKDNKPMHRCAQCGIGDWTDQADKLCYAPGTVFDPFLGSGTTARVAKELGLRWVGSDLSFEYLDLQAKVRTGTGVPSDWREGLPMFESMPTSERELSRPPPVPCGNCGTYRTVDKHFEVEDCPNCEDDGFSLCDEGGP